jgi:predicted permease
MATLMALHCAKLLSRDTFILLCLSICFGSNAFFGVAFFETLYEGRWLDVAVLMASMLGMLGIVLSLFVFEYAHKKDSGWRFFTKIATNPLIISLFTGVMFSLLGIHIEVLDNGLSLLAKTAGGLAIFSLGIFIYDNFSFDAVRKALVFSLFRALALPVVTFFVVIGFLDLSDELKTFLVLQSGIPAAIALAVFAERYEYKVAEVVGMVIITSIFSFIELFVLFFVADYFFSIS